MPLSIPELVGYIIGSSGRGSFSSNTRLIQNTFLKLRDSEPGILGSLTFLERGNFPFSEELERALFWLEFAGVLSLQNPAFDEFAIRSEDASRFGNRVEESLSNEEKEKLLGLARQFAKLVDSA